MIIEEYLEDRRNLGKETKKLRNVLDSINCGFCHILKTEYSDFMACMEYAIYDDRFANFGFCVYGGRSAEQWGEFLKAGGYFDDNRVKTNKLAIVVTKDFFNTFIFPKTEEFVSSDIEMGKAFSKPAWDFFNSNDKIVSIKLQEFYFYNNKYYAIFGLNSVMYRPATHVITNFNPFNRLQKTEIKLLKK